MNKKSNLIHILFPITLSFILLFVQFGGFSLTFAKQPSKNKLPEPMGKIEKASDTPLSVSHPKAKTSDLSQKPPVEKESMDQKKQHSKNNNKQYPMSHLKTLSYDDLTDLLVTISWEDIPDLFQFNQDSKDFYHDPHRMQAIIDALQQRGYQFTDTDAKGIDTLVEVLRSGFYLGFYHEELGYLNERDFHDKCLPALKAIAQNSHFTLGTPEQDEVVDAYGRLIGNASSDVETITYAGKILTHYRSNLTDYITEYTKGNAVYSLINGIDYDIQSYMFDTGKQPDETPWFGKIDSFIDEVGNFALLGKPDKDNSWLINNGIYYVGRLGKIHSHPDKGLQTLTESIAWYPNLSEQHFLAAFQIHDHYDGKDANGNIIDIEKLKKQGQKKYLPENYTFDGGKFIVKAGDNVTEEKIKRLYWASKEVKAQFHRAVGNDKALEPGNPDDVLTVVLYNSPEEYQMNRYLYGYETNNGGIYIEGIGTFFTYERTPEQSIYSLEELFRHEFTHYLNGRYLVPGMFGEGMYENDRLTWFEEGSSEFFAGSTRTDDVKPRKSIVNNLPEDPAQRYSLSETLHSRYGSWDFYYYAFALQSFLYNNKPNIMTKLNHYIKNEDASGYDRYIETLSQDFGLDQAYQDYMQYLVDNRDKWDTPQVSDDYLDQHPAKENSEVYADIEEVSKLTDVKKTVYSSQFFNTFTLKGIHTGDTSKGKEEDWKEMNQLANQMLKQLSNKSWSGYKTVTCYFTNYQVNSSGQYQFDVVFHGLSTDPSLSQ